MLYAKLRLTKKQHREFLCVFLSVRLFRVLTEQLLKDVFIAGRHCEVGMVFQKAIHAAVDQRTHVAGTSIEVRP